MIVEHNVYSVHNKKKKKQLLCFFFFYATKKKKNRRIKREREAYKSKTFASLHIETTH